MEHTPHPPHDGPGYETSDAKTRPLILWFIGLGVVIAIVLGSVRGMLQALERPALSEPASIPPTNLYQQLGRIHKDEDEALRGYSYDRKTGVAHIPIERAMDLIAERGVPKGKGPRTDVQLNSRDQKSGGTK